jgi:hypothetical protein
MINLEFNLENGQTVMLYDVERASQKNPIELPAGATHVVVSLSFRPVSDRHDDPMMRDA